jgi:two-component system response regulator RegX3
MRIAILEDDPSQRELLIHWLTLAGHQAAPFERGDDFLKSDCRPDFEMLILDWNLPDVTGIEVLQRVRQTSKMPVLFCTARTHPDDTVKALRSGADDYLIKPLRRLELLARIESVARRGRRDEGQEKSFELEHFRVDCEKRIIMRDGAAFELTDKDFDVAVLFLRNVGRLLLRGKIHEPVWGASISVTSRTIDTHVSRVRTKLGLTPKNGWQLKSVYGHGYRLETTTAAQRS